MGSEFEGGRLVVSDPVNIRYLSGFTGSAGLLVLDPDDAALYTDSRYLVQASVECPEVEIRSGGMSDLDGPLLLEGHHITAEQWLTLGERAHVLPDLVGEQRAIKDEAEVETLRQACLVSELALSQVLATGITGRTEREVARQLEWQLAENGGEGPGFPSIVASGPNSAIPHHQPSDRVIARGDLLKIDFGARVAGYHADITRTFAVGTTAQWQQDLYDLVRTAQAAGRAAVSAEVDIAQVDSAARSRIAEAGHGEHFGHGLGHGVGLQIHERPLISAKTVGKLAADMTITIEPGVYLPDRGGVRIEDTLLVTETGHQSLVSLGHELVTVD